MFPLLILLVSLGCVAFGQSGEGSMFAYPMYAGQFSLGLFTTGTWLAIFAVISIARRTVNKKFDAGVFKWVAGPGLNLGWYTYLSH